MLRPRPGDTRWHHLSGPVAVLATAGREVRVVNSVTSAIFWTWDTCLWRAAQ